ncbi:acyloxyacyl hydrolase [uncultured Bacteroides sp.]|uniref:acyloxyacyl hydrolase n=2 Tax=uncultured Bacteroides sp. TaxID=162156 RepID=UPI0025CB8474|nr:acyloxyacyl hydrolase [uncultured Bacteroides sp.]
MSKFRIFPLVLMAALSVASLSASEADTVSRKVIHMLGADFRPSYVFPTHDFFRGDNMAGRKISNTFSGHLKYGFKFSPATETGRRYPYAVQGIGVAYNTFGNVTEVSNPLAVYVFQTSRIANITPCLSFDYEWNFGASFGWKKFDDISNPQNRVVGSKINAYINLGFLLDWRITPHTHLRTGVGVSHYSNGNTRYPNSGVNTVGASVGVTHFFCNEQEPNRTQPSALYLKVPFGKHISYDLIVYGATRKKGIWPEGENPLMVPGSFGIIGLNFNPLYNFNKHFRAGVSLDFQYDESANIMKYVANDYIPSNPEELKFYRPAFKESFSAGLSVRAEIVMPIFSINLGIGKNFFCRGDDTNAFYQTFVLKTDITKNFFIHTGYQLYDFRYPNNLMVGLGVRFNAKR